MRIILFKKMFAKQCLPFRGKNGIYLGQSFSWFLKIVNCQAPLFMKMWQILSYGWQENIVSLCSHPILVLMGKCTVWWGNLGILEGLYFSTIRKYLFFYFSEYGFMFSYAWKLLFVSGICIWIYVQTFAQEQSKAKTRLQKEQEMYKP